MFESSPSAQADTFDGVDDGGVLAVMSVAAKEENARCARRLEAIGELYARRAPEEDDARTSWAIDGYENVVAEISAELGISRGRARGQLTYAIRLREDLPRVAAVFNTGAIDMRMVIAIVVRTSLVNDAVLMARVDARLAAKAPDWMRVSGPKLEERIDWVIATIDPAGLKRPVQQPEDRYVSVEIWPTESGLANIEAQLRVTDGEALNKRLDALADSVCANDPRTRDQRRADALGALGVLGPGLTELHCECESSECTAAQRPTDTGVTIHVLAEQSTVDGTSEKPGYLPGYGPIPASVVQDLAQTAKLKPLIVPDPAAPPEQRYRPSAALAEFVRLRDLTCRFPGCDRPAERCDVDHTVPYPIGPTHPSNLKCLCRFHHLLKTFYIGVTGWADQQLPDATVIWTSPSGRTYRTKPGGSLFFPVLASATGQLTLPDRVLQPGEGRGLLMPRRQRTRAEEREERVGSERRINEQILKRQRWLVDELEQIRQSRAANDPPPF